MHKVSYILMLYHSKITNMHYEGEIVIQICSNKEKEDHENWKQRGENMQITTAS